MEGKDQDTVCITKEDRKLAASLLIIWSMLHIITYEQWGATIAVPVIASSIPSNATKDDLIIKPLDEERKKNEKKIIDDAKTMSKLRTAAFQGGTMAPQIITILVKLHNVYTQFGSFSLDNNQQMMEWNMLLLLQPLCYYLNELIGA